MFSAEILKLLRQISKQLEDISMSQDLLREELSKLHGEMVEFQSCTDILACLETTAGSKDLLN